MELAAARGIGDQARVTTEHTEHTEEIGCGSMVSFRGSVINCSPFYF
jgi:hypothetical protein